MTETMTQKVGTIGWVDLTVPNADDVRDFYKAVVGWTTTPVDMGGYDDYVMNVPGGGDAVSGVCWKRGTNVDLPSQWLMYITVTDLDASIRATTERGGEVLAGPRGMGSYGRFCVIRDPAGAVCALIQPPA